MTIGSVRSRTFAASFAFIAFWILILCLLPFFGHASRDDSQHVEYRFGQFVQIAGGCLCVL